MTLLWLTLLIPFIFLMAGLMNIDWNERGGL